MWCLLLGQFLVNSRRHDGYQSMILVPDITPELRATIRMEASRYVRFLNVIEFLAL
jgi:hypothetical protein